MKVYNTTTTYLSTDLDTNDFGFSFYYGDAHLTIGNNNVISNVQLNVEVVTQDFLGSANAVAGLCAGNNEPLTVVAPEYAPYPFAGNSVIAYITAQQGGLTVAEKELEDDFEFLIHKNATTGAVIGYIVWGTFKVTKTDFYVPQIMATATELGQDAVTMALSWNPIDGLEHSSLDYSEKISRVV